MLLKTFKRGPDRNFTYLFGPDAEGAPLAAVDPGDDVRPLVQAAGGRPIAWVLVTHGHGDHVQGLRPLREKTGARIVGHARMGPVLERLGLDLDDALEDGETIALGPLTVRAIFTPGHHPASACFLVEGEGALFTGDTLFVGNCGRTDLPGGDARALFQSLRRLAALPPETVVYPGHDYGRTPTSTIGREAKENATLAATTFEAFDALP